MAKKRAIKRKTTNDTAVENDENLQETNSVENGVASSSKSTSSKKKKSVTTKAEQKNETLKTKANSSKSKSDDEEDEDYEVEKILEVNNKKNGKREFLIRWKNYSAEHDTWEPEENLSCHELIKKFLESQEQTKAKSSKSKVGEEEEKDEGYEVEKILDVNNKKNGKREFLIRWKNYSAEHDTWEPEENLSCHELIKKFLESQEKTKAKSSKSKSDDEEDEDYEVEKILDVNYKKNGKREFLIRWKKFSAKHDTWEPEDNLSCDELITKFMEVQEKREKQPRKDLRERPKAVTRYTASADGKKRSKRTTGPRKTYTEREDEDDE